MIAQKFVKLFEKSFREHWDLPAYTDYGTSVHYSYRDLAAEIAKRHLLFESFGIAKGDKIAVIGRNSSEWALTYLSVVTCGAVVVPILPDFNPNDIHQIVNHSDSKLLFVADQLWKAMDFEQMPGLLAVYSLNDRQCLAARADAPAYADIQAAFERKYPDGFAKEDVCYPEIENTELASINYTSGTTGFSKGVMMTGNNLAGNVVFGLTSKLLDRGKRALSFLPLSHAYGCAFEFLTGTCAGSHVTFLTKVPAPQVLIKALNDVQPDLIITVPLIFEKIYKNNILPKINTYSMKLALNIPFLNKRIYGEICEKLKETLGGKFYEVIIGGAALNKDVEEFFVKIGFPFTVGYGMTECGPLIAYSDWQEYVPTSSGRVLKGYMEAKILSDDPENVAGEILVRGEHVMAGYYKNEEKTREVLDEDGWLHTGDLGTMSPDGDIFIRGRSKSMILGPNGQNIYPEEIEAKLNNMPYVAESLVLESEGKLFALVCPDKDEKPALPEADLLAIMDENLKKLNRIVAPYEKVSQIKLHDSEFEKTPKRSIKRFIYERMVAEKKL